MTGVVRMIEFVDKHAMSVLLHCSDGWDRTAQLSSLALMCLDPYYRTLEGFQCLIEKEWLSFGHKFGQRHGYADPKFNDEQRSPIFAQFLDCVYQLLQQFPESLEFNENSLLCILDHLHSCRFGTFLFNSEKERVHNQLKLKTTSLWSMMNAPNNRDNFLNYFYVKTENILHLKPALPHLQFWRRGHLSWYFDIPESPDCKLKIANKNLPPQNDLNNNHNHNGNQNGQNNHSHISIYSHKRNKSENNVDIERRIEELEAEIKFLKAENKRLRSPELSKEHAWRTASIGPAAIVPRQTHSHSLSSATPLTPPLGSPKILIRSNSTMGMKRDDTVVT